MRALLVGVAMVAGMTSAACSQESSPEAGEGASRVTSQDAVREEFSCRLDGSPRIVQVYPSWSEIHRIDVNMGTWSMVDGLTIEVTPWVVKIRDDEGTPVATIDKHGSYYAEEDGKPVTGTCNRTYVETVKPTSAPLSIDEALEYSCTSNEGDVELVVRPKRGEIDMIRAREGRFYALDGVTFEAKSLETSPPKNQLSAKDRNSTLTTIVEGEDGVTFKRAEIAGTCEKRQRRAE